MNVINTGNGAVEMQELLQNMLNEAVLRAFQICIATDNNKVNKNIIEPSDRCYLNDAVEITRLSKSKIYKLTASGGIPCERFNSRLLFSRKKLNLWMDTQTVSKDNHSAVIITLANSANKKRRATA